MDNHAHSDTMGIAQRLRRLAKTTLRRLGVRPRIVKPYKPDFAGGALALRLGITPTPDTDADSSDHLSRLAYAGARKARELIGPRFFVDPRNVNELTQALEAMRPGTIASLRSHVSTDATSGIPVYALQGPVLGAGFPWGKLPPGPGQDQMYAKRPHRFAFVPRNALACLFDPGAAIRLDGMLESWMKHAMQGRDPLCYDSNLGVIQRVLALSWGWAFLAGRPEQENAEGLELEWRLLKIIAADIRFLEPLLGKSTPNNHLLADWFAAWYLRTIFPELLDRADMGDESRWCHELFAQTYPDGGSFEHSSHYHEFACEMGVAYVLLSRRAGKTPDPCVKERVRATLAYQCAMTGPEASPLPIGNAIEDTLFPLDPGEAWCPGSLREIYRALFEPELAPTRLDNETLPRAFWLLGGFMASRDAESFPAMLPSSFMQAGLHVLADSTQDARLIFRTGPATDTHLAAGHMHADLLAIYLELEGRPCIVDAGTYTYRRHSEAWGKGEPNWRAYFAGPNAHNVLSIGGADPLGPLSTDFRKRITAARVSVTQGAACGLSFVEGNICDSNAYEGWQRTCIHIAGEYWLVLDKVPPANDAERVAWLGIQFAPSISLKNNGRCFSAGFSDRTGKLAVSPDPTLGEPQSFCGSIAPIGGWVSPRYGELQAAPQLRFKIGHTRATSAILLSASVAHFAAEVLSIESDDTGSTIIHVRSGSIDDIIILGSNCDNESRSNRHGINFNGRLLWVRSIADIPRSLRWLEANSLAWPKHAIHLRTLQDIRTNLKISSDRAEAAAGTDFSQFEWPRA